MYLIEIRAPTRENDVAHQGPGNLERGWKYWQNMIRDRRAVTRAPSTAKPKVKGVRIRGITLMSPILRQTHVGVDSQNEIDIRCDFDARE